MPISGCRLRGTLGWSATSKRALVRPNRTLDEVDVRAVTKKLKDKGFARQVDRDQVVKGAQELSLPFEEHVMNVVEGLKTVRGELGL